MVQCLSNVTVEWMLTPKGNLRKMPDISKWTDDYGTCMNVIFFIEIDF